MTASLQQLTCPRQRAFAPGHQARYPASYAAPRREAGCNALVSCRLSAAGIRFLGILSRPGIPPLLRSAYRAADSGTDPSGVSVFRTRETRPGPGALCTPGTTVPARLRVNPAAAACRLATARSLPPRCHDPSRDVFLTRHQQGFTGVRPSRPFPSPVAPGRNGDPWALPWAPHLAEQDPAAHARAGTSLRH